MPTDETLIEMVKEVIEEGGTKDDLFVKLELDRTKWESKVTQRLGLLRKSGVAVPDFRKFRRKRNSGLTKEEIEKYNEALTLGGA